MAHITTNSATHTGVLHGIADMFSAIGSTLSMIPSANAKMRQIEALSCLSDSELCRRGLRREDIVRKVMGGSFL